MKTIVSLINDEKFSQSSEILDFVDEFFFILDGCCKRVRALFLTILGSIIVFFIKCLHPS